MSKVDAQRAMREARYAAMQAQAPATRPAVRTPAPRVAPPAGEPAPRPTRAREAVDESVEPLCGHRSIGNKSCQRPAGHAEKNHRYK